MKKTVSPITIENELLPVTNKNKKPKEQTEKMPIGYNTDNKDILEKYEFRSIRPEEAEQAAAIEQICFPPNEACSRQHMLERITKAPELFLVAADIC